MSQTRAQWCAILGRYINPTFPEKATAELLGMIDFLDSIDESLFTAKTALHVATEYPDRFTPSFGQINKALNEYRQTYVPDSRLAQLPSPSMVSRAPPDDAERIYVSELLAWHRAKMLDREMAAAATAPKETPLPDVTLKGEQLGELRAKRGLMFSPILPKPPVIVRHAIHQADPEEPPCETHH